MKRPHDDLPGVCMLLNYVPEVDKLFYLLWESAMAPFYETRKTLKKGVCRLTVHLSLPMIYVSNQSQKNGTTYIYSKLNNAFS